MQVFKDDSPVHIKRVFHLFAFLIFVFSSVLSYQMVSHADLLAWDTKKYTVDNTNIHEINAASLKWMFTETYFNNWIPLTLLSHAIDIQMFGFEPSGHHWISVLWHIGCAWLIYIYGLKILSRLFPTKQCGSSFNLYLISLFSVLVFTVHPLRVESVAWVAERKDLMCGFFFFLCLICYDAYVAKPTLVRYILTFFSAAAAVMSKPMAMSLPVVLLMLDIWVYKRLMLYFWQSKNWFSILLEKFPFILIVLLSMYMTLQAQFDLINSDISVFIRIKNSLINWLKYLGLTLFPISLSPFYPYHKESSWLVALFSLCVMIALFLVGEWYRRRGQSWLIFSFFFYSITILPVIGIVHVGAAAYADRYTYIPTIPLYFIMVTLIVKLIVKPAGISYADVKSVRPLAVCMALLLFISIALGYTTFKYTKVWQTEVSLWEYSRERFPRSIHTNLFLAEAYFYGGRLEDAMPLYRWVFSNRSKIKNTELKNRFIYRYYYTAFELQRFVEAEGVLNDGWQEGRLWYMDNDIVFYEAARVSIKLKKYDMALELLDRIEETHLVNGILVDERKISTMKSEVKSLIDLSMKDETAF